MIVLGFKLMLLGMFMVFVFLSLLFISIHAVKLATEFFAGTESERVVMNNSSTDTDDESVLAVISAAIEAFETDKKRTRR